jgi:hypothetical protein
MEKWLLRLNSLWVPGLVVVHICSIQLHPPSSSSSPSSNFACWMSGSLSTGCWIFSQLWGEWVWVGVYQLVVEMKSSCEVSEWVEDYINWLVEIISSCEVNVAGRLVGWNESSCEVSECRWKFINWVIEDAQYWGEWVLVEDYQLVGWNNFLLWGEWVWVEVYQLVGWKIIQLWGECGWKVANWFVESITSSKVSECGWKLIWLLKL